MKKILGTIGSFILGALLVAGIGTALQSGNPTVSLTAELDDGTCDLGFVQSAVNFGTVASTPVSLNVELKNFGTSGCVVHGLSVAGDAEFTADPSGLPFPINLPGGAILQVEVTFDAADNGAYSADLGSN